MFKRLSRMMRSFFGFFISVAENPELILEQNIRDMNDQVPRMNESIAMVKANATLLEREEAKYKADVNNITSKAKAVKKAFMNEKERKTHEALNAIADYRRSQWQKKVADVMEQFEVTGISATHDEMVRKIEESTAMNEARMEMALGNVDQQKVKIEEEAEQLRAGELVKQFKVEMGLMPPQAAPEAAQKTIGAREAQKGT